VKQEDLGFEQFRMDYYRLVMRPFWITIGSRSNDFYHRSLVSRAVVGMHLDESISGLVRKGLEVEIQQSMDMLQVLRKNP
jgi:hypothetical protein